MPGIEWTGQLFWKVKNLIGIINRNSSREKPAPLGAGNTLTVNVRDSPERPQTGSPDALFHFNRMNGRCTKKKTDFRGKSDELLSVHLVAACAI